MKKGHRQIRKEKKNVRICKTVYSFQQFKIMRINILWLFLINYQNNQHSKNENIHSGWGFIEHGTYYFAAGSVVHKPVMLASPENLLEFQNLRPHPRPNWIRICILTTSPGDSYAH